MSSALAGENAAGPAPDGGSADAGAGRRTNRTRQAAGLGARYGPIVAPAAAMAGPGSSALARDSSMGNDEVASRWAASLSLRQLAHLLRHVDAVHGLYYLLMHGWVAIGTSPAVLRIPSVIAWPPPRP